MSGVNLSRARTRWTVILPVKTLSAAKTRLAVNPAAAPDELALAFFQDTLAAVIGCPDVDVVLVATSDPEVTGHAESSGCVVVDDSAAPGINAAARLAAVRCQPTHAVAVIVSDLPCLTPGSLQVALGNSTGDAPSFVADADGEGTTMWMAGLGVPVEPRFGSASRAAHRRAACHDLVAERPDPVGLLRAARRDVDTPEALIDAAHVGLGPATLAILRSDRPASMGGTWLPEPEWTVATVLRSDVGGSVTVVDEGGRLHGLPAATLRAAGVTGVRPGQRLAVRLNAQDGLSAVRLP